MSANKAPIYLKRRSRKGKKEKLRDLLSSDMISPPLGDFRHTIHIGSGSGADDLFGDLSFLQGKFHLLPGQQGRQYASAGAGEGGSEDFPFQFSRTSSVSVPSSESSPLLKNALSLPVIGTVQALTLPVTAPPPQAAATAAAAAAPSPPPSIASRSSSPLPQQAPPPKPPRLHLEDRAQTSSPPLITAPMPPMPPPPAPPAAAVPHLPPHPQLASPERTTSASYSSRFSPSRSSDDEGLLTEEEASAGGGGAQDKEKEKERPYLSHAGSMLSLHLDLGPSILDDVLQIMDGPLSLGGGGGLNGGCMSGGRTEIYT
ncbi:cdc42 effector protein 2 [Engraulis encrasicolus]|uniref:cdc42 effector protein 2 n=1 Tax=Engraulis encrasicolus TaxID=184585 RepID=UPI002FD4639A